LRRTKYICELKNSPRFLWDEAAVYNGLAKGRQIQWQKKPLYCSKPTLMLFIDGRFVSIDYPDCFIIENTGNGFAMKPFVI
jgi:hypothetical protein